MLSPGLSVTNAFFHDGRRPANRPTRFSLPRTTSVRTSVTVTLNRACTAARISILFASLSTSNATFCAYASPSAGVTALPPVSRMRALFSVSSGRLMTDCGLRMTRLRLRDFLERLGHHVRGFLRQDEDVVAEDVVNVQTLGRDPLR